MSDLQKKNKSHYKEDIPVLMFSIIAFIVLYFTSANIPFNNFSDLSDSIQTKYEKIFTPDKLQDFTEYKSVLQKIQDEHKNIQDKMNDKTIFKDFPDNKEAKQYINSYLSRLAILNNDMLAKGNDTGDYDSYMKTVDGFDNRFHELQSTFIAQADFSSVNNVKMPNGELYTDSGKNFNAPQNLDQSILKKEAQVRKITVEPDDNSDYRPVSEKIADVFGLKIDYNLKKDIPQGCLNHFDGDLSNVLGMVCEANLKTIYVTNDSLAQDSFYSPLFVNAIKHEIAHLLIQQRCGTLSPSIISEDKIESMTSSYAVLYLGADKDILNKAANDFPAYTVTDESDQLARQIHDQGKCTQ